MTAAAPPGRRSLPPGPALGPVIGLMAMTMAAGATLARYVAEPRFVGPVVLSGLVAPLVVWAVRRAGLPSPRGAGLAATTLIVAWTVLPETTVYGIPWAATLSTGADVVGQALSAYGAPSEVVPDPRGLLIVAVALTGIGALVADRAVFAMGAPLLAVGPSLALFMVGGISRSPHHRLVSVGAYVLALALFFFTYEVSTERAGPACPSVPTARRARWRPAALIGAGVVAAAVAVGSLLPDAAGSGPLAGGRSLPAGTGVSFDLSPLVDIRGSLAERPEVELFTAASDRPTYWRLTSLEVFDGSTWSASGTRPPPVDFSTRAGLPPTEQPVVQEIEIGALSSSWLPVAYEPIQVQGVPAGYDPLSGTVSSPVPIRPGQTYQVSSIVPSLTERGLRPADWFTQAGASEYLHLPPAFSPRVVEEAQRVVSGARAAGPYASARALQDYFRQGFTYDLSVAPGHDGAALERFLFDLRTGYCEQFAGAFAAMARAVGLPARVALGFTPGQLVDGRYQVRGGNAHAWPEVYLAGRWVAFEPTPGRAVPGGESYTGVPDSEMVAGGAGQGPNGGGVERPASTAPHRPTSVVPSTAPGASVPQRIAPGQGPRPGGGATPLAGWLAVPVVAVLAWAVAVPGARDRRRRRRRAAATAPDERVMVAWTEAAEALARAGARRRPTETLREYAPRAGLATGIEAGAGDRLVRLAALTTTANYAEGGVTDGDAAEARRLAAAVEEELARRRSRGERLSQALDPRRVRLVDGAPPREPPPGASESFRRPAGDSGVAVAAPVEYWLLSRRSH